MAVREYEPNTVLSTKEFSVVGTRPVRHDGADKVTGRALYGADFAAAGLLYGMVLRSPHAHAVIKSIDTSKAEALDGVRAVVTAKDYPDSAGDTGAKWVRDNLMASDKALYRGHAVAAVAAVNAHVAEEAVALIEVEYEVLPAVMTAPEAMKIGAPVLHDSLRTDDLGETGDNPTNIASHLQQKLGDVRDGFAAADIVIEREFVTKTVHQGYIEPHNSTALWNNDGRLQVWCSTQGAFTVRDSLAQALDIPVSQIKVTPMEIGGGFGDKIPTYLDATTALLSKKSGRPVKILMSRKDVFEATGPTSGSRMTIKMGATNDGKITAATANLEFEAGAYPGSAVGMAAMCVFTAYVIPNILIDGYDVVTNKPKAEPYRAPGAPNAAYAAEQVVAELATQLGIDPLDFRLKNAAQEGTVRPDGLTNPRIGCVEVLEAMKDHAHYDAPLEGPYKGRGVAIGFWFNIGFDSACHISVNADGTITLVEGSTDIGGSRTSIAMQAAEVLGIPAENVRPSVADTDSVGYTAMTGGSRTTFATGWAAYEAAQDVKRQMIERASQIWDVDAEGVDLEDGVFKSTSDPELSMSFKDLAEQLSATGGPITGRAALNPQGAGGSYAGNIVDVEVDPDTGKVTVTRFTTVQDAGKAIHPSYVEGQMQGGSVQGIGWALNEEYFMNDDGGVDNSSLLDYRLPTILDLPMIDTVIVEVANPGHPFGVRGVGEANIVPPLAAVANAVADAIGTRMNELPMNPAAVAKAIRSKNGN